MKNTLNIGDILVVSPFAWIMSQAVIRLDFFWFFVALWLFNIYANRRRGWDE